MSNLLARLLPLLLVGVFSTANLEANADENELLEPENVAEELQSRILKGVVAEERDYRYHVAIMRLQDGSPYLLCGGAIIHRHYVLTAAHCVNNYTRHQLLVAHGGLVGPKLSEPQNETRTFHPVARILIPMTYSGTPCRRHHNDIAILKVAQSFDLGDYARYAKVNLPEYHADYEGVVATVTGHGPDYPPGKSAPTKSLQYVDRLRTMRASVISNEDCQYMADVVLTEGSLCASSLELGSQTCFEDEGGPLVHDGTVIGILNARRCDFGKPELFTRVSAYLHFIKTVLEHELSYDIRDL